MESALNWILIGMSLNDLAEIVVVSINYRLGPFGFLRLTDVTDYLIDSSGNEGLIDQRNAIKWVKKYIFLWGLFK